MKFKLLQLLILSFFISQNVWSQDDYIIKGKTYTGGIEILKSNGVSNYKYCQVKSGDTLIKYTPNQITEYGYTYGKVYKTHEITIKDSRVKCFLELVVSGKYELYFYKENFHTKRFFILQKDSNLFLELPKENNEIQAFFRNKSFDCNEIYSKIPYLNKSKYILKRFLLDSKDCNERPFLRTKYGFYVGLTTTLYKPLDKKSIYSIPRYDYLNSISLGTSIDIPIKCSNFSFHPEINLNRHTFYKKISYNFWKYEIELQNTYISIPILFRYTFINKNFSPFLQIGPNGSIAIENESVLSYKRSYKLKSHKWIVENQFIQKMMIGYHVGIGSIIKYNSKLSFFNALCFSSFGNLNKNKKIYNIDNISFNIGMIY